MMGRIVTLITLIIITVAVLYALALFTYIDTENIVTLSVSLLAVVISLVGLFKSEIFSFDLGLSMQDIIVMNSGESKTVANPFILPIFFTNIGIAECIIEHICIKITDNNGTTAYANPYEEIDYDKFISRNRTIHADNIKESFSAFLVSSKSGVKKYLMFLESVDSQKGKVFIASQASKYKFEVYIQTASNNKKKKYFEFNVNIDNNQANSINQKKTVKIRLSKLYSKDRRMSKSKKEIK